MRAAIRFVWNATRGCRLRPWKSEYVKWRIETYSGLKAEELTTRRIAGFVWLEKGNLLRFLRWSGEMEKYVRQAARQGEKA